MPETAVGQVEDLLKDVLEAYAPLAGWSVLTDQSIDIAVDTQKTIIIHVPHVETHPDIMQGQTTHYATVEFGVVSDKTTAGVITRTNHEALANIIAALHQDRTLGGKVQDIQELDVAAPNDGRDVGDASLQVRVEFITTRGDWFTRIF